MYGTKAAFDYINVGGRCAYETNKIFEFPAQPFYASTSLYTTEHDNILCEFMDTSSYVEMLFNPQIESDKYYMLRLVYYTKNINNLKLKITWKKEGDADFCSECYEHVVLDVSSNFLYTDIDLRQNSEWVSNITNLRVGVYNTEIVPLFIRYLSIYSPTTYKCSHPSCPYYSQYSTPCGAGKDLHILTGDVFEENTVSLFSDSSFLFSVYGLDFIAKVGSGTYFLDNILSEINKFFDTMPIPGLDITIDENRIKLTCNYVKPAIKYTELSEKLGFFDAAEKELYTYTIENTGSSDYIDIAGNLKGIYEVTALKDLNFSKVFFVGFKDDGDMYPGSTFNFIDQTVIFHTLIIQFDGYINCFELYCKAFSGGGKILIFRRSGDTYNVVDSYTITSTILMEKHTIDWLCNVYKGDVIGVYNLKLGIPKKTTTTINHYGVIDGYSSSINKSSIENVSFSAVSIYAYFKPPTANDIPIVAIYNEVAYVDKLSFLLEYDDSDVSYFNIIYNNTFSHEITGCQIDVKDSLDVVTTVSGEIIDIECLSDSVFFSTSADFKMKYTDMAPPAVLGDTEDRDVLRYSWAPVIIDMYENNDYTYTFIAGDVFFYYEFPTFLDICKVNIYSEEEESVDNYLLKVLDNTKAFPSFSNTEDVITLDTSFENWEFDIEGCTTTSGIGVFIYNYGELPNLSLSEIELYTRIGSIPEYILEVTTVTDDDYIVPFSLDTVGAKNDVYIGNHIKKLTINIGFISDEMVFNFNDINIYSSYVPDDYFVSSDSSGEGTLKIYNTRSKKLKCYLFDYNTNLLNNLIYEYDFDNEILHRGFVPIRYTHAQFYFTSSNYLNDEYNTYALKNLINTEEFFVTKSYNFKSQEYDDWYVPYDYLVPGYDGQFVYIEGGLRLRPLGSEAIRWFNYINTNEFYNDIDIELMFDYVGNLEDFVFIGLTCCDRDYTNYLKFYGAFQFSSEYGLEFKLSGDPDPTYYTFDAFLGRDAGLKINKRGSVWTFSCFYGDAWHELTSFTLFDTEILISISTLFNAPTVEGNIIAEFKTCNINASKIIYGKKVWYTTNDGLSYVYGGHVLDDSTLLDNINKELTFTREYTIKKFIYDFNTLSAKYLKFINTKYKSIKITEIKCYLNDELIPIKQGMVSYSDDLFFGTLEGSTDYLDDNVIINESLAESICKGGDDVLSAVGVVFDHHTGVNKAVVYYVEETGAYEPLRVTYGYDNVVYYDVYDNFSLFLRTSDTALHCLFNEFSGYKGYNEVLYNFVSNSQYSTYFSSEGVLDHKWSISSSYVADSGGVWLKHLQGVESLYSKFSIDGDFIVDVYFDSFSNYSNYSSSLFFKLVFRNNTYYNSVYVEQDFIENRVRNSRPGSSHSYSMEDNRTFGGLRIKRLGSVFYFYYRKYGTTWYQVDSYDYGSDYIYPVDIYIYTSGSYSFDLRIEKVIITDGTGIADTDFLLLESPSANSLFVRGRQFSTVDTYALAESWSMTQLSYPFSFSLAHCVNSSIATGEFLVSKPYSFGLTYEGDDLSLWWFSEYFTTLKINNALSYSTAVNSIVSMSVDSHTVDENLFTSQSDIKTKAIYKSRYDVNTFIEESFKTGEGTFDKVHVDTNCQPGYLFDGFTAVSGSKASAVVWFTYDTIYGTARVQNDMLYFSFSKFCYRDTFDGNDGDSPNPGAWSISYSGDAISPQILSDKLRLYLGGSSSGWANAKNVNKFVGDFDVQVDYELASGYINQKGGWGSLRFQAGGKEVRICRSRDQSVDSYNGYRVLIDGSYSNFYSKSGDYTGKFRLRRSGSNIYCYFWMGSTWYHLETVVVPTDDADISLYVNNYSDCPMLDFRFNNFNVEHPNIRSTYNISGDIDIQVTFSGIVGADSNRCGFGLAFEIDGDNRAYLKVGYDSGNVFMCGTTINGSVTGFNVPRTNSYGQSRIVRNGSDVTIYYKDGDVANWTEFHTFPSFSTGVGRVFLGLYSASSSNPSGYFNDFVLTTSSGDANCRPGTSEDDFTGANGSFANTEDWTTHDSSRGTVRIQNNSLNFSFVK